MERYNWSLYANLQLSLLNILIMIVRYKTQQKAAGFLLGEPCCAFSIAKFWKYLQEKWYAYNDSNRYINNF